MKIAEGIKGNINLHYEVEGKGLPLIFLHGGFCDIEMYKELRQTLSTKHKVYSIDLPMHGKSPKGPIEFEQFADYLNEFCKSNRIENPTFCCHSAGSIPAIIYASKYKTKRLYLLDPLGTKFYKIKLELKLKQAFVLPIYAVHYYRSKGLKMIGQGIKFYKKNILNLLHVERMYSKINIDLTEYMKKIICDVVIYWANHDEIVSINNSSIFLKNINKSRLKIINGCHNWPIFDPEKFNY